MAWADKELTDRNFQALSQGLKMIRGQYAELLDEVKKMREMNATLVQELATVKQNNGMLMARFHGTGSTS